MIYTHLLRRHSLGASALTIQPADTGRIFVEVLTGILILYALYQYLGLRAARSREEQRQYRTRLLQLLIAFGGLVYLGPMVLPGLEAWPIQLGVVIQDAVQTTATDMGQRLHGTGLQARLFQIGVGTYLLALILIAFGVQVPIIIWNVIFGQ